ncbi:hypothetical protein GCM10028820_04050 [Tessaracoccus terricola]
MDFGRRRLVGWNVEVKSVLRATAVGSFGCPRHGESVRADGRCTEFRGAGANVNSHESHLPPVLTRALHDGWFDEGNPGGTAGTRPPHEELHLTQNHIAIYRDACRYERSLT